MKTPKDFSKKEQIKITGTLFSYSYLCNRKVWLYYHRISFEHCSHLVALGKAIDETTYGREKHNIDVDGLINIDYIKKNVVQEVKKSDKLSHMAIQQLKYYLYVLRQKDIFMTGVIRYPLLKKTETVLLEEQDIQDITRRLDEIRDIILLSKPPNVEKQKACYNCAYYEFCFSE